jgi:hypothetical protein
MPCPCIVAVVLYILNDIFEHGLVDFLRVVSFSHLSGSANTRPYQTAEACGPRHLRQAHVELMVEKNDYQLWEKAVVAGNYSPCVPLQVDTILLFSGASWTAVRILAVPLLK